MYISIVDSPLGKMEMRTDDRALLYYLPAREDASLIPPQDPVGKIAVQQFAEYYTGGRTELTVPAEPAGTEFQRRVWKALTEIPFGEIRTYGEIAEAVGCPGGARAVGGAVGANPVLIRIPCHRVVAAGGIGGFSAGLWRKRSLLLWEGHGLF